MNKPGRNDTCPCGSGIKYKKCCLPKNEAPVFSLIWKRMRRTEGELVHDLLKHADKFYGTGAILEAWDEFTLWDEVPFDMELYPEIETVFIPWLLFNWIPDNTEVDEIDHYPEKQIAVHYLESKGQQLHLFERQFIEETCSQPYSFFMVTGLEPGVKMSLRDLFLKREITVHERQGSLSLQKGSVIYARTITMNDNSIMVGCAPTVIPPSYVPEFIDIREGMKEEFHDYGHKFLLEHDHELRTVYYDIRESLHNPMLPKLQNTDGDSMQLNTLYYTLNCTPHEALDALATLSLSDSADDIIQDGEFDDQGNLTKIEFPWLKSGNKKHHHWDNTIMGNIVVDKNNLTIDVNSMERAERIKHIIKQKLGKRAEFRNASIQSSEKLMEDLANRPPDSAKNPEHQKSEELMALPEVQEKLKEMADQHWLDWLDTPIPALKGQTPREATKSSSGRERLDALLFDYEQRAATPQPFKPNISALRKTLGMDNA